ncbi:mycothiol synthase [Hoyosella rhizosphaerae]|uniref:Mycothiol acetyltransferase n=1 Tax=Hoyosella rhizosphaerae TaxID=1755582 RepID=A0A916UI30_9ACTN|nr:mycothiol synthase [Hoyosella rhizosphaerae]MBN4928233.1 mycothiol synthase [Hoyosella rhizosphaerae]GGC73416.1 mycothiol acetyltransferase [Hoyosella rhizosphaerae]
MTERSSSNVELCEQSGAVLPDVQGVLDESRLADGTDPISEQGILGLSGTVDARHVIAERDGVAIGVGTVRIENGTPNAELAVIPSARDSGVGGRILDQLLTLGGPQTQVWSHGDLPAAAALASSRNLRRGRELLQMRLELGGDQQLPADSRPADVVLTTYGQRSGSDVDAEIVRVNNAAFSWHPEQGGWTLDDVVSRRSLDWFDPEGLFLAYATDDSSKLLGFHWTKVHPATELEPSIGEVYIVGVDPAAHGRGLGSALTLAGLQYLRDRGLPAVTLYVESDNVAALRTYQRLGFGKVFTDVAYIM